MRQSTRSSSWCPTLVIGMLSRRCCLTPMDGIRWRCREGPLRFNACLSRQAEGLSAVAPTDTFLFDGGIEALKRFCGTFTAKNESLEMDREKMVGTGIVGHAHGLLRRAMRADPGLV